jgi:type IV pilus assembly protein PilA
MKARSINSMGSQSGFSLVELMIVVAIIGILSSIAVPQFQKFIFKARQTEAKTALSALYSAEQAFFAEYSAYHSSFDAIGYRPTGKIYYNVGFTAVADNTNYNPPSAAGPSVAYMTSGQFCNSDSPGLQGTGSYGVVCQTTVKALTQTKCVVDNSLTASLNDRKFLACAQAKGITAEGGDDEWSITQGRILDNGIPAT